MYGTWIILNWNKNKLYSILFTILWFLLLCETEMQNLQKQIKLLLFSSISKQKLYWNSTLVSRIFFFSTELLSTVHCSTVHLSWLVVKVHSKYLYKLQKKYLSPVYTSITLFFKKKANKTHHFRSMKVPKTLRHFIYCPRQILTQWRMALKMTLQTLNLTRCPMNTTMYWKGSRFNG